MAEVAADNEAIQIQLAGLEAILASSLDANHQIDFEDLKSTYEPSLFDPGILEVDEAPIDPLNFVPTPLTGVSKHMPSVKRQHDSAIAEGQAALSQAQAAWRERRRSRLQQLATARDAHACSEDMRRNAILAHNAELDEMQQKVRNGDPEAVITFVALVLEKSHYPEGVPHDNRLAYVPDSKQLVAELELPNFAIVPEVAAHKYVKTGDKRTQTARPLSQRRRLYSSVVAQIAIRTLHEVFESDEFDVVDTVVLNGHVESIDPGTGQPVRPCLISLRTTKDTFRALDLSRIEPLACLKTLGAGLSRSPSELAPVVQFWIFRWWILGSSRSKTCSQSWMADQT
jgi:restriction system protein